MHTRSHAGSLVRPALAVVVLLAVLAAPARAAEKAIWGPTELPSGASAFPVYEELAVDTLQLGLSWSDVAPARPAAPTDPSDPAYRWPRQLTAAVAGSARSGIRLALLVTRTPAWANGGRAPEQAPNDPRDFADFLRAAGRRYPAVRRWMIWGEPNRDDRFQPNRKEAQVGPRAYAKVLDAAYVALKTENRRNIVIGGNTWTNGTVRPADFVRWMRLPNGRRPRLDWFGHNPFPFRFPKLSDGPLGGYRDISDTDTFSRDVRRAYKRTVPLWLSEYTIQSGRGSDVFGTFVSERNQARYLTAGYEIADDVGRRVAGLGWLSLLDEPEASGSANWGLMTYGLRRKPAFAALAAAPSQRRSPRVAVVRTPGRALRVRVILTPRQDGVIGVELRRGGRRVDRARLGGKTGRRRSVRLRHVRAAAGTYTIIVRSSRAATVRRIVRAN